MPLLIDIDVMFKLFKNTETLVPELSVRVCPMFSQLSISKMLRFQKTFVGSDLVFACTFFRSKTKTKMVFIRKTVEKLIMCSCLAATC